MKIVLVIDCNRIFAALIKEGTTRNIFWDDEFEFIAPDFILEEIEKYKEEIMSKTVLTQEEFNVLLSLFLERITIIPQEDYSEYTKIIEISDIKDIPYVACCLATKAHGIWTHDPDFQQQTEVKVFTNMDLLRWLRKSQS